MSLFCHGFILGVARQKKKEMMTIALKIWVSRLLVSFLGFVFNVRVFKHIIRLAVTAAMKLRYNGKARRI